MSFRYSRVPTQDMMESGSLTFDYSSAFTYENKGNISRKYKSYFTYGTGDSISHSSGDLYSASFSRMDCLCYYFINVFVYIAFFLTFPISIWFAFKIVPGFEKIVVFRWGHLHQTKGPGMVFVMPLVDTYQKIDMRMKAFNVPPQQVITGDGAIIEVGADVYYRIADPEKSITKIQNLDKSTRVLVQTSLLNQLVRLPLTKIDGHRNSIAESVQTTSNKCSQEWGIEICRLELSQIKILQKSPSGQPKPSVVLPPGMGSLAGFAAAAECVAGGSVPEAFQQLASAFLSAQGQHNHAEEQNVKQSEPIPSPTLIYDDTTGSCGQVNIGSAASHKEPSVREILQLACRVLNESLVRKVDAVYQFQLHGEEGSVYFVDLKHGQGQVGEGVWSGEGDVDASLMMTVKDLQLMLTGQLKPFQAYMNGRLRVSGDLAAALRLETFVDKVVAQTKIS
ncbi:stomatin-like protein 1 isoform X2 [Pomacea canaliculata]|uniref:stomatin-like protein 1 isoform X2 n=1 Tax=Pomacea canaliculata TaxID=400727 RepID=UPI000D72A194|nr:stomatin-like protein 1 isoform X2 [Pomacea canaliculata]